MSTISPEEARYAPVSLLDELASPIKTEQTRGVIQHTCDRAGGLTCAECRQYDTHFGINERTDHDA